MGVGSGPSLLQPSGSPQGVCPAGFPRTGTDTLEKFGETDSVPGTMSGGEVKANSTLRSRETTVSVTDPVV